MMMAEDWIAETFDDIGDDQAHTKDRLILTYCR